VRPSSTPAERALVTDGPECLPIFPGDDMTLFPWTRSRQQLRRYTEHLLCRYLASLTLHDSLIRRKRGCARSMTGTAAPLPRSCRLCCRLGGRWPVAMVVGPSLALAPVCNCTAGDWQRQRALAFRFLGPTDAPIYVLLCFSPRLFQLQSSSPLDARISTSCLPSISSSSSSSVSLP